MEKNKLHIDTSLSCVTINTRANLRQSIEIFNQWYKVETFQEKKVDAYCVTSQVNERNGEPIIAFTSHPVLKGFKSLENLSFS